MENNRPVSLICGLLQTTTTKLCTDPVENSDVALLQDEGSRNPEIRDNPAANPGNVIDNDEHGCE